MTDLCGLYRAAHTVTMFMRPTKQNEFPSKFVVQAMQRQKVLSIYCPINGSKHSAATQFGGISIGHTDIKKAPNKRG